MKKLFGGIDLTYKKIIISAIIVAIYTAAVASIPIFKYTSFYTINTTLEVWIFFGIFIIMNSKSNKEAALKCFVFFLISQPLIYLFQVPFSWQGWNLFKYYKFWFILTIFCLPMGYIGYYMKKDKWWGYLILLPMILLLAYSYSMYLSYFTFSYPKYILICLFCIGTMIIYPLYIFNNKKIKTVGTIISILLILFVTILGILNPYVYNTSLSLGEDTININDNWEVYLTDKKYGDVNVEYDENIEEYLIKTNFKKEGKTTLIALSPDGNKYEYMIDIKRDTYEVKKVTIDE